MKRKRGKQWGWPERTPRDDFIVRIFASKLDHTVRGWLVTFPRSLKIKDRYIAVQKHGGLDRALRVARAHRDAMMEQHGVTRLRSGPMRRAAPYQTRRRKDNTSGITGVVLDDSKGSKYPMWVAYYHPSPGVQKRRGWSVRKYTHDGAKLLAIMWRNEQVAKLRRKR